MAGKSSPKRVSFEEPRHSSASDEDWNPVEVGNRVHYICRAYQL
jgi:hypothetical protein